MDSKNAAFDTMQRRYTNRYAQTPLVRFVVANPQQIKVMEFTL